MASNITVALVQFMIEIRAGNGRDLDCEMRSHSTVASNQFGGQTEGRWDQAKSVEFHNPRRCLLPQPLRSYVSSFLLTRKIYDDSNECDQQLSY